ncbi:hypothetical protein MOO44_08530 [Nicoliella spurrieriana]|uniref:Uncharacterized protein n=1 Tax=Nicoliella spurrieriana TaxID=2925830 RepID=A0A976X5G9_9LACO|nr:hypothetical protein [Nicoliella spurrieriana]UQS86895.1 hypothetical protein MOO44_08530 [Nicoliella spurrieriana]
MKKSMIYLATLAALTTGGIAVMNTVNPSFISGPVAYAGVPYRTMLVAPLSDEASQYINFYTNFDGGPSFINYDQTAYQLGGDSTSKQYAVRSTAPYIVESNGINDNQDNDKDYLTTIYEENYVPNPNSGVSNLQPIKVAYICFDSDGNNVDDFYSKYVSSSSIIDNTYSISDLKRDVSNMSDSDFMQYGFGQHVDQHDGISRSKLLNEINIILKYYLHEDVSDTPSTTDSDANSDSSNGSSVSSNQTQTSNASSQTNNQQQPSKNAAKIKRAKQSVTKAKRNLKRAEKKGKQSAIKQAKQTLNKAKKQLQSVKN